MHQLGTVVYRCTKNQVSSLSPLARMAVHNDGNDDANDNICDCNRHILAYAK